MSDGEAGTTLETAAARLAERIDALEAHVGRLVSERAELVRRIAALEAENGELAQLKERVAARLDEAIARIDHMVDGAD